MIISLHTALATSYMDTWFSFGSVSTRKIKWIRFSEAQGAEALVLQGKAEGLGLVQPGKNI